MCLGGCSVLLEGGCPCVRQCTCKPRCLKGGGVLLGGGRTLCDGQGSRAVACLGDGGVLMGGGHPLSLHLPIGEAGGGRQGGEEEVVVVDEIRLVVGNLRYVLGRRCITKVNSVAVHQCLALVSMMSR